MKILILDTGTIITLSMNSFLYLFESLRKTSDVRFVIPPKVKFEIVDRPIGVPRFELEALRVQDLINKKIIELPTALGISNQEIKQKTDELMKIANRSIQDRGKFINIVSEAEISCLGLSSILTEKGIENIIAIDERTTRLLSEKPENLAGLMSHKLHHPVHLAQKDFTALFRFIRSTEMVYAAHKLDLLKVKGPKALEAALFATKFKGSSVSFDELKILKKL